MKYGITLAPSFPAKVVAKRAKMAEDAGIEYVWIGEEFNRELYVTLTTIALNTEKVKLGLGGTNPYTRSLAVSGISILTLDEVSNGRVVVGMGSGGPAILHKACITPKTPFSTVRDSISILRRLFAGDVVTMQGHEIAVQALKAQYHNSAIPIYIAGKGPRMMQLAGEACQGVYMSGPRNYLSTAMKNIQKGAKRAHRTLSNFDLAFMRVLVVDEDHQKAETQAKKTAPFSIRALLSDYVLEHSNLQEFKEDCQYIRTKVNELFQKAGRSGTAPPPGYWYELGKHVKKELLDQLYIYGTPAECVEKIRALIDSGITQIVFSIVPIGGRSSGRYKETMKLAFEKVINRV